MYARLEDAKLVLIILTNKCIFLFNPLTLLTHLTNPNNDNTCNLHLRPFFNQPKFLFLWFYSPFLHSLSFL